MRARHRRAIRSGVVGIFSCSWTFEGDPNLPNRTARGERGGRGQKAAAERFAQAKLQRLLAVALFRSTIDHLRRVGGSNLAVAVGSRLNDVSVAHGETGL